MTMFVIKRGYLYRARHGRKRPYTTLLKYARTLKTRAEAEALCLPGEKPMSVWAELPPEVRGTTTKGGHGNA